MSFDKSEAYLRSMRELDSVLEDVDNRIAVMATINCILKTNFPYYYWVGFYQVVDNALLVGPYQGTMGCLHITFDRGVCGAAAREKKTQLVEDVHQFPGHVACDALSRSEIVTPVFNKDGQLIAVFDVDSVELASFDATDQAFIEKIMSRYFGRVA